MMIHYNHITQYLDAYVILFMFLKASLELESRGKVHHRNIFFNVVDKTNEQTNKQALHGIFEKKKEILLHFGPLFLLANF